MVLMMDMVLIIVSPYRVAARFAIWKNSEFGRRDRLTRGRESPQPIDGRPELGKGYQAT
jgi:hypothetical protein